MKLANKFLITTLIAVTTLLASAVVSYQLPKGWIKRGEAPDRFDMGVAKGEGLNGKNAATIKSIDSNKKGFGSLMQNCKPDQFLEKKIKLTGYLKTKDVTGSAALWMRVDKAYDRYRLDNMDDRSLKGTHDWTKCEIIMYVPKDATNLAFGGMLDGNGQIWFCNLKFEPALDTESVTGEMLEDGEGPRPAPLQVNPSPTNLDFTK